MKNRSLGVMLSAGMFLGACGAEAPESIPVSGDSIAPPTSTVDQMAERIENYTGAYNLFTKHALGDMLEAGFVIIPDQENFLEDYSIVLSHVDWPEYATQFHFESDADGKIAFFDMITGPIEVFGDQDAYNLDGSSETYTDHHTPGLFYSKDWFLPNDPEFPVSFAEYALHLTVTLIEALNNGNINVYPHP